MSDSLALENAAIEAKAARDRLTATTRELQARLNPATLVEEAKSSVVAGARELADNASQAARRRPGAAAGIAALAAAVVLRKPLGRIGRRLFGRNKETRHRRRR